MKIKIKSFVLKADENENYISVEDQKKFELKFYDLIDPDSEYFTDDIKAMEGLLQEDPERDKILTMLILRGLTFTEAQSPIFNSENFRNEVRNELSEN